MTDKPLYKLTKSQLLAENAVLRNRIFLLMEELEKRLSWWDRLRGWFA